MPLVALDRVSVRLRGRDLLSAVSLEVREGGSWAVLGANGSGKSTLLRLLRGDEQPTPATRERRRYFLDGVPASSPIGARARIAMVSPEIQEAYRRRDWDMRAESAIATGFTAEVWLPEEPTAEQRRRIDEACALLGIDALRRRSVLELSSGELRRVLLARALVSQPRLLLLDEPGDGLDPEARALLVGVIARLARKGPPLVVATHREEEVVEGIEKVAILVDGRIAASGGREAMLERWRSSTPTPTPTPTPTATATPAANPTPSAPLLQISHADVLLDGRAVLRDVSWTVLPGEHWAVTGPNGAGKSTLLRLAVGDEHALPGGTVRRLGLSERTSVWEVKARVGVVSPELQARFRADVPAEHVVLSGLTSSIGVDFEPSGEERAAAERALREADALHLVGRSIHALSYGEMRRLVLARALVRRPELLVLDEPMNGLDAAARASLRALLERLSAGGTTLVVATHHREEIPRPVGRELELWGGRVAYQGPRRSGDRAAPPARSPPGRLTTHEP